MTNNEICQGCWSTMKCNDIWPTCKNVHIKDYKDCPCAKCLVKSMCSDVCEEFAIYTDIPKHFWDMIK